MRFGLILSQLCEGTRKIALALCSAYPGLYASLHSEVTMWFTDTQPRPFRCSIFVWFSSTALIFLFSALHCSCFFFYSVQQLLWRCDIEMSEILFFSMVPQSRRDYTIHADADHWSSALMLFSLMLMLMLIDHADADADFEQASRLKSWPFQPAGWCRQVLKTAPIVSNDQQWW